MIKLLYFIQVTIFLYSSISCQKDPEDIAQEKKNDTNQSSPLKTNKIPKSRRSNISKHKINQDHKHSKSSVIINNYSVNEEKATTTSPSISSENDDRTSVSKSIKLGESNNDATSNAKTTSPSSANLNNNKNIESESVSPPISNSDNNETSIVQSTNINESPVSNIVTKKSKKEIVINTFKTPNNSILNNVFKERDSQFLSQNLNENVISIISNPDLISTDLKKFKNIKNPHIHDFYSLKSLDESLNELDNLLNNGKTQEAKNLAQAINQYINKNNITAEKIIIEKEELKKLQIEAKRKIDEEVRVGINDSFNNKNSLLNKIFEDNKQKLNIKDIDGIKNIINQYSAKFRPSIQNLKESHIKLKCNKDINKAFINYINNPNNTSASKLAYEVKKCKIKSKIL